MQTVILLIVETPGGPVVVPRRAALTLEPGDGDLDVQSRMAVSAEWHESVQRGWRSALSLSGEPAVSARLEVGGQGTLTGESAGLPVALLALAALHGRPAPNAFSTGAVRPTGFLDGGISAHVKAGAIDALAGQMPGMLPRMLCPPIGPPVVVAGARVEPATDVGHAFAALDPEGYRAIRAAHRALRSVPGRETEGAFGIVRRAASVAPARAPQGVALADAVDERLRTGAWILVGEKNAALWATMRRDATAETIGDVLRLARESVRAG